MKYFGCFSAFWMCKDARLYQLSFEKCVLVTEKKVTELFLSLLPLQDQQCAYNSSARAATCKGYKEIPEGNERALTSAVAKVGPVSVGIDAMQSTFLYYKSGT